MPTFQMWPRKHECCINQTDKGKAWYLFSGGEDWPSRRAAAVGGGGILSRKYILQLQHSFSKSACFELMRSSARTYWHTEERQSPGVTGKPSKTLKVRWPVRKLEARL